MDKDIERFGNIPPDALKTMANYFKQFSDISQNAMRSIAPYIETFALISKRIGEMFIAIQPILHRLAELTLIAAKGSKPLLAINELAEVQYTNWEYLREDFVDEIIESSNVNTTLRLYHEKKNYESFFDLSDTLKSSPIIRNKKLLEDVVFAFENKKNDIAVLGLTALIDDTLSVASGNISTSIYKRAKPLIEKLEDDRVLGIEDFAAVSLFITFEKTMTSFSANSDFSKPEPKGLNRHWIMHGRSKRRKTKLDCVKLINFLYGIILLDELSKDDNTGE